MKKLAVIFTIIFLLLCALHYFALAPEKYSEQDVYERIVSRGCLRAGINLDARPFGFIDENGEIQGYDADLARYIAQYILKNPKAVEFYPVTPANRMLKVSTDEVDVVIAAMTITPQREELVGFSVPYDYAGQALLVRQDSKVTSIAELAGRNAGVVYGTTAEKNMLNLVPNANIIGFKNYAEAYAALKSGKIEALTSDDTILSRFVLEDKSVKLLPKRYSREPYGIAFKKGKCSKKLKETVDFAISDMKQKNVLTRLRRKWGL